MICDGEKEERENDFNNMMKDKNERQRKKWWVDSYINLWIYHHTLTSVVNGIAIKNWQL